MRNDNTMPFGNAGDGLLNASSASELRRARIVIAIVAETSAHRPGQYLKPERELNRERGNTGEFRKGGNSGLNAMVGT